MVEAFPFEATLMAEPEPIEPETKPSGPPMPAWLQKLIGNKNPAVLAGIAGGVLLALLALPVILLAGRGKKKKTKVVAEQAARAIEGGKPSDSASAPASAPGQPEQNAQAQIAAQAAEQAQKNAAVLASLKLPAGSANKAEVLTKHIAGEAKKDPTAVAQAVRSWLHGDN